MPTCRITPQPLQDRVVSIPAYILKHLGRMMGYPKIRGHLDKSDPLVPHSRDASGLCVSLTYTVKAKASYSVSYVATISAAALALACASIRTLLGRVKALVVSTVNRSRIG